MRKQFGIMFPVILLVMALSLSCSRKTADLVVCCGFEEVFIADISDDLPRKIWNWTAENAPGLPSYMRNKYLTTDECKSYNGGKQLLVTSSGGGIALITQATGEVTFYASLPNAHSAELLPGGIIAAAGSYSESGNRINLYRADTPEIVVAGDSLYGAHAVVWDKKRSRLWALGTHELRWYEPDLKAETPVLNSSGSFPLPADGGHDMIFPGDNKTLWISAEKGVWIFDIETGRFEPHPEMGDLDNVKSMSWNPVNGRLAYVMASGETWWDYYIRFMSSDRVAHIPGEKLYKVRWLYNRF